MAEATKAEFPTEQGRQFLEARREGYAKGAVTIHVTLNEEGGPGGESMWANRTEAPDIFEIDNVPFFASHMLCYGDFVRAHHPAEVENPFYFEFDKVVRRGPWTPFVFVGLSEEKTMAIRERIRAKFTEDQVKLERANEVFYSGCALDVAAVGSVLEWAALEDLLELWSLPMEESSFEEEGLEDPSRE